ncbi:MAG: hypothetical protein OXU36_02510 [Candidatus Poribacteria bacterium]|nr:hypothetical protein [Candidatus Poribacteria bacterium]
MNRQHTNSEDTVTTLFVEILMPMSATWRIYEQTTRPLLENQRKPDVIIRTVERYPVAVEVKIDYKRGPNETGEKQAREYYLGKTLRATGETIASAIAIRLPYRFRTMPREEIRENLEASNDFAYALLSIDEPHRFPKKGWLEGSIADIATAIRIGATPITKIERAAEVLENGIHRAAVIVNGAIQHRPHIGKRIGELLVQEPGEQTTQMAMLIISNALVFQSSLARKPDLEAVPSLSELTADYGQLDSDEVLRAWREIQKVNYAPIFNVAYNLVETLAADDKLVGEILSVLRDTARELEKMGLAQEHELAGIVFQKLIANRKILKANYTRPESSALLCALALPELKSDPKKLKIADFACGTGSLLNGVYQRLLMLYEQTGGNGETIHQYMMENNLVGCDILPNAAHLTASIIASTYPDVRIGGTRIHTMPYGTPRADGLYAIGALNLLSDPAGTLPLSLGTTETATGQGTETADLRDAFRHGEFDIVIQNPPYTRSGADGNSNVPKNIFADRKEAAAMRASRKAQGRRLTGNNPGEGPDFVDLADRMLKRKGTMAFVLPVTAITGSSWQKVRKIWAKEYHDVLVITIAHEDIEECAFSADTGMAECLVVAKKGKRKKTGHGIFVCLTRCPNGELEALEIAKEFHRLENIRQLDDDMLSGGERLQIGGEVIGHVISAPIVQGDAGWPLSRVKDMSVVQAAHCLTNGVMRIPRQTSDIQIAMRPVSEIATLGIGTKDIRGGGGRGVFDVEEGCPDTAVYPCLWHVDSDSDSQRAMLVPPNAHAHPRPNSAEKIERIMRLNGRVHYNVELRFNANSLTVMFTKQDAIGVNKLPNVIFDNKIYEYAWTLWCNSTLGLLCHWYQSGKQQQGRGVLSRVTFNAMPTLDVRQLSDAALTNAERIFNELKHQKMLPFNQMDADPVRHELDRLLLSEVLGITEEERPDVHEGLALLRKMLCQEPSIHGGKKSKVKLGAS